MKILFLDFDGVLNCYDDIGRGPDPINPAAVARLNVIVARTGARIVITSSWRLRYPLDALRARLAMAGFEGSARKSRLCTPRGDGNDGGAGIRAEAPRMPSSSRRGGADTRNA